MLLDIVRQAKIAFMLLVALTVLTGMVYPVAITTIAQLLFPWQANGSLIKNDDQLVGSLLIGQSFTDAAYFWSRPSATTPFPYNALNSLGSNRGPSDPSLLSVIQSRIALLKKADSKNHQMIPIDLVTASASGLDPEISPLAAFYQVSRIAKARKFSEHDVEIVIQKGMQKRFLCLLGEPRVNVLQLNLALDHLSAMQGAQKNQSLQHKG